MSGDGERVFSSSLDGTLKIWDSISGAHITQLVAEEEIWGVALCGAGRRIALGVEDGTSRVVDIVTTGVLFDDAEAHKWTIRCASFSPNGLNLVTGSWDGTILEHGRVRVILTKHTQRE